MSHATSGFSLAPSRRGGRALRFALVVVGLAALLPGLGMTLSPALGQAEPTPLPLFALPSASTERVHSGGSLALLPDGATLIVANPLSDSATLLLPGQERIIAELPVGRDPRSVAVFPDGALALVANRLDSTLSVIDIRAAAVTATLPLGGASPVQVVAGENGLAYVALRDSNEIVEVDVAAGRVLRRIPAAPAPAGLALWGDFLYVTHFWSGALSLIYVPQGRIIAQTTLAEGAALAASIAIDVTRGTAWIPITALNSGERAPLYDSLAYPGFVSVDLRDLRASEGMVALDSADRPVNLPLSAVVDRFRRFLYIAHYGSGAVSAIDLTTGAARAHIEVGNAPDGLVLTTDNSLLYVHNTLDGTVSTINTATFEVVRVQVVAPLDVPAEQLIGAQLFSAADDDRMSTLNGISCATCHFDGLSDGRMWQGMNDGRNTPLLFGLGDSAPYLWSGQWAELADVEFKIRALQAGQGLVEETDLNGLTALHAGLSDDLDALVAYMLRLQPPTLPPAGTPESRAEGRRVYGQLGCAECHAGPAFTNGQLADVGTGGVFDTPSLRWLPLSAPYFHDGSAATLDEVFGRPGTHQIAHLLTLDEYAALLDYLRSLPEPVE